MEEAVSLAAALPGLEVVGSEVVRLTNPRPGTLFGPGKVEELATLFRDNEVELVLWTHAVGGLSVAFRHRPAGHVSQIARVAAGPLLLLLGVKVVVAVMLRMATDPLGHPVQSDAFAAPGFGVDLPAGHALHAVASAMPVVASE